MSTALSSPGTRDSGSSRARAQPDHPPPTSVIGDGPTAAPPERDPCATPVFTGAAGLRNARIMGLLERIAIRFNEAGVPLMVLKGAALNLTLYERPDERPMDDLDLLIKPDHLDEARALLEGLHCLRGETHVRADFFPRFHYETEYIAGHAYPVKIDLHVRPFRPLRYARLVPVDALWSRAERIGIGRATVCVPSTEDMLIHLATHTAVHGSPRLMWLKDIQLWIDARRSILRWDRVVETAVAWRLALPVREALARVENEYGVQCPPRAAKGLAEASVSWRDRLALRQAPRDAAHPWRHVAVNALCTRGWRFVLGYLWAVFMPDRDHMAESYGRRHWGWLLCAHALRLLSPIVKRAPKLGMWFTKIETRESPIHGIGVFATSHIKKHAVIARFKGKPVQHRGQYVVSRITDAGRRELYEITGKLKFLNHHCRPNAELQGFRLIALRPVHPGQEITIDYGLSTCRCGETHDTGGTEPSRTAAADAA